MVKNMGSEKVVHTSVIPAESGYKVMFVDITDEVVSVDFDPVIAWHVITSVREVNSPVTTHDNVMISVRPVTLNGVISETEYILCLSGCVEDFVTGKTWGSLDELVEDLKRRLHSAVEYENG